MERTITTPGSYILTKAKTLPVVGALESFPAIYTTSDGANWRGSQDPRDNRVFNDDGSVGYYHDFVI